MSNPMLYACWPLQMPPTSKAVLVALADKANEQGECWPSLPQICGMTCYGRTAVIEAIKWLESHAALRADRIVGRGTRYTLTPESFDPSGRRTTPVRQTDSYQSVTRTSTADEPVREADGNQSGTRTTPSGRRTTPVRQTDPNPNKPSITKSKSKSKSTRVDPNIELPDWLPADVWSAWVSYRSRERKRFSPEAQQLGLRKLAQLREEGHDPRRVIEQSIGNDWTGLFPPRDGPSRASPQRPPIAQQYAAKTYEGTPDDQLPAYLRPDAA